MNSGKSVTVIGGGIAGLSSAVFLAEKGCRVKLIESSPKLGGRAYSFYDQEKKMFFDNGQHILAGWYENTFDFLKITGSFGLLDFQSALEINFINENMQIFRLKCTDDDPPMNLVMGLLKFKALNFNDKFRLRNINKILKGEKDSLLKYDNAGELLRDLNQTDNLMKYFWEPLILAVFNTKPLNVGTEVFINVLKTGFGEKGNSNLVIPSVDLNALLINKTVEYFERKDVTVITGERVKQIDIGEKVNFIILENGEKIFSDYYISAVPFFSFARLFDEKISGKFKFDPDSLKHSCIISVHIFLKEEIPEEMIPDNSLGMTGLTGTSVQWIFLRSRKHLSLVISGADDIGLTDESPEKIFETCVNDLKKCIRDFDKIKISDYRVIKEKRATFIPSAESGRNRPGQRTEFENFFIAGDWTDTGLPSTIESAVKSSKIISDHI
ncbi:MAG: FAD-dependent oxidoreductase [Bacteroidetes bacterium]|nr:FAD-dependent oxidoreductase [Bacteroidota bacterium]